MRTRTGVPEAYVASSGSLAAVAPVAPVLGAAGRGVDTGVGVTASSVTGDSLVPVRERARCPGNGPWPAGVADRCGPGRRRTKGPCVGDGSRPKLPPPP